MARKYYPLPLLNSAYIKQQDYFFLFETGLFDKNNFSSYIFINPLKIIKINHYSDIEKAFDEIERYAQRYFLAGYFSYELGYYFEKKQFGFKESLPFPLMHICVFDKAISFNHKTAKTNGSVPGLFSGKSKEEDFSAKNLKFNFNEAEYAQKISRIKEYIRRGDTYQINFTAKFNFSFRGSALSFYQNLKNRQIVPYNTFCKFKDEYILSFSPELFFSRNNSSICSKPMKGTIGRGNNIEEDQEQMLRLKNSNKDLAENIMIVDLVRNDLGRIAKANTVKAAALFNIEKYNTLFQMTSVVQASLRRGISYFDIFKSIFPGGSVTGAPKIRSMQIIKQLEKEPRNIYCGALGIIFPNRKAVFNLPIRTLSIIKNKGEMGVGSGIVYDSEASREFKECMLKAKFLTDRHQDFCLLETMLWNAGYNFLGEHLRRLKDSAQYFGFYFSYLKIREALGQLKNKFKKGVRYKVRLLLDRSGGLKLEYAKIQLEAGLNYTAVSKYRVDPESLFCYHKTTNRSLYDSQYIRYLRKGYFDVIFLNTRNEVTEGAISNIIIERDKKYYTPPVSSGILPGIFRRYFIKKYGVTEKKLFLKDLLKADKIFLCNSVRGLTEVKISRIKKI